jgi:hypothetical protein
VADASELTEAPSPGARHAIFYFLSVRARYRNKSVSHVNVAQRGGMCIVLTGRPPARLIGPAGLLGSHDQSAQAGSTYSHVVLARP